MFIYDSHIVRSTFLNNFLHRPYQYFLCVWISERCLSPSCSVSLSRYTSLRIFMFEMRLIRCVALVPQSLSQSDTHTGHSKKTRLCTLLSDRSLQNYIIPASNQKFNHKNKKVYRGDLIVAADVVCLNVKL